MRLAVVSSLLTQVLIGFLVKYLLLRCRRKRVFSLVWHFKVVSYQRDSIVSQNTSPVFLFFST